MSKYQELKNVLGYMPLADLGEKEESIINELLDRAIPAKPIHRHALKAFGKCPFCDASVNITHNRGYCGACGKALDWSKDDCSIK